MTIPLATTAITVKRVPSVGTTDPYDEQPAEQTVVSRVRAHISAPSGREQSIGGAEETVELSLACDPCDLTYLDTVVDEADGQVYRVDWVKRRRGLGLDHMAAGLRSVTGAA